MSLSDQQKLVIERAVKNFDFACEATAKLKEQATTVFASSVALMSFATAGNMMDRNRTENETAWIVASLVFGAVLTALTIRLFRPSSVQLPGPIEAEQWRDDYLDVDAERCVLQIVSDTSDAMKSTKKVNASTSGLLRWMLLAFLGQVICVAVAASRMVFSGS